MEKRRRIILYGNSVILGTIGASLQRFPELEIIPLFPPLPELQELGVFRPDVILFDVQAAQPAPTFSLLKICPSLMLIGIDPESDQILAWMGRRLKVSSTQDLVEEIILKEADI
jgi:hypothetical protein